MAQASALSTDNDQPLISCLIVTANRPQLLQRSLLSYVNQTYPHTELVVVDNGESPIEELIKSSDADNVAYIRVKPSSEMVLGDLRNISLEQANGNILTCWDDDDWFHPRRLEIQYSVLQEGMDACCLKGNLFHVDTPKFIHHPYRGYLAEGSPSTIMHVQDTNVHYPSLPRQEDTAYLQKWRQRRYKSLPLEYAYLFVRCFHGTNVSGKKHFLRRLKNSPASWLQYYWYNKIRENIFEHPKFKLTKQEQKSFQLFLKDSKKLGLI